MRLPKLSLNQKIAVAGILTPAAISIFALFKVQALEVKVNPVVEMKPQIINVINNVTEVKKEIANLQEMLRQQDQLRVSKTFRKRDLGIKVKKIDNANFDNEDRAGFLIIELESIPFENSVVISNEIKTLSFSTYKVFHNIVRVACLRTCGMLNKDTDFINVTYLPDANSEKILYTIQDMTYDFGETANFHFQPKLNT